MSRANQSFQRTGKAARGIQPFDGITMTEGGNRQISTWVVMLQGPGLGLAAFGLAELSLSYSMLKPGDHDMMLAQRLGLVYTLLVGLWLGWLQRSYRRTLAGAIVGLVIGGIYFVLCLSRDFFAIMVGFPSLLGGGLAAFVGSNRSTGIGGFFIRLAKGILAGLVLGTVYMFLLNFILSALVHGRMLSGTNYVNIMWKGGLPAMGIASSLFLLLMKWAVGLVRLRFEDT